MRTGVKLLAGAGAVAGALAATYFAVGTGRAPDAGYLFATLDRGEIARKVSSSGKLNPVTTVSVGSQVSGQISEINADFNTRVSARQVIARIDPRPFAARLREARAEHAFAEANVAVQKASLTEIAADRRGAQAALNEAEQELARKQALFARRVVAKSAVDTAVAARDRARAALESIAARLTRQDAQIRSALAQVQQKAAAVSQREIDLEHTVIRSPVDGVVISRSVDTGQTVAASLQAPELFVIAEDLRRMQVETSVDEADIGSVREGQTVVFTVDAYPDRSFDGTVRQIRKAPLEVSNVITYTVVVSADNPDLALLPGMTANVEVIIGQRENALRVVNAALRFTPPGAAPRSAGSARAGTPPGGGREAARKRAAERLDRLATRLSLSAAQKAEIGSLYAQLGRSLGQTRRSGLPESKLRQEIRKLRAETSARVAALLDDEQKRKFALLQAQFAGGPARRGRLWVVGADGAPREVAVMLGLTDGRHTEIREGDIADGARVIVGLAPAARR